MKFKRIAAAVLSVILASSAVFTGNTLQTKAFYQSGIEVNGYSADLIIPDQFYGQEIYGLDNIEMKEGNDTLVLPSKLEGKDIRTLSYLSNDDIRYIIFPDEFTHISRILCGDLQCVVMPDDIIYSDVQDLGNEVTIIGGKKGFASYYASVHGNPFRLTGDINGDGEVKAGDLIGTIKYVIGQSDTDKISKMAVDIDRNGQVNIIDVIKIKDILLGDNDEKQIDGCVAAPVLMNLARETNTISVSPLSSFSSLVTKEILLNTEDENGAANTVYSPLSLYMALSVLSECSGGETRKELNELLFAESNEDLRKINQQLFKSMYSDNYARYNKMCNSIWLDDLFNFNSDTLKIIAEEYYSSVFVRDLQSQSTLDDISDWVFSNTSGKLKPVLEPDPDDVLKILNTVTFKESWDEAFSYERESEFKLNDGNTINCNMMSGTDDDGLITKNDKYIRYSKNFKDGYRMNFVLPAENVTTDDILSDKDVLSEMFSDAQEEKVTTVHANVPSFDIASKYDLVNGAKRLGISHLFHGDETNFSPILDDDTLYVGDMMQEAVITVNKDGCEAAAYTMISVKCECTSADPVEFTADRPFIYYISDSVNTPLFVGVINDPTQK